MSDPFAPGLLQRLRSVRNVAVVKASRIGDFICATPAFRALRIALPDAEITMITLPMLRELAERSPHLDHYVPFPGYPGLAEQFFDARKATQFFMEMQARQFDLAVQLQGSGVYSNPFTLMLGARATAGFVRPGDGAGRLDAALPLPETGHEVQRMLALTTFLGAPPQGERNEFPLWPKDHAGAEDLLVGAVPPLIGLHPAARDQTRRWPLERFVAAGQTLCERYDGTVVLLGDSAERPAATILRQSLGERCIDLVGRTSLATLGAVIDRLAVLVTNDTGPAHIAYACGMPTVTVFGGGDPRRNGPLSTGPFRVLLHPVPCRPCESPDCPIDYYCLDHVTPAQVVEAAEEIMR